MMPTDLERQVVREEAERFLLARQPSAEEPASVKPASDVMELDRRLFVWTIAGLTIWLLAASVGLWVFS
jgi:hypothetical protein